MYKERYCEIKMTKKNKLIRTLPLRYLEKEIFAFKKNIYISSENNDFGFNSIQKIIFSKNFPFKETKSATMNIF